MMAAVRRRRSPADAGMSLVEVLVAAVLLTVVIGLATSFLMVALRKQSSLAQGSTAATSNQNGLETLTRVIRQGVYPTGSSLTSSVIQTATAKKLVVTSRLSSTGTALAAPTLMNTPVKQYTFQLTGTTLYWQQAGVTCTTTCTYGTPSALKPLITGVQTSSAVCPNNTSFTDGPFHYATQDPVTGVMSVPAAPVPDVSLAQTPPNTLGSIVYVSVNLFTRQATGPDTPGCNALSSYIQLRNKA